MTGIAWCIVDRYVSAIEAHTVRGRLEAENIPALVGNEFLATQNWLWAQAVGGVVVRVPEERLEEARAVIAALDHGDFALPADEEGRCPECGGRLVLKSHGFTRELSMFSSFFLALPLPFRGPTFQCQTCGH